MNVLKIVAVLFGLLALMLTAVCFSHPNAPGAVAALALAFVSAMAGAFFAAEGDNCT